MKRKTDSIGPKTGFSQRLSVSWFSSTVLLTSSELRISSISVAAASAALIPITAASVDRPPGVSTDCANSGRPLFPPAPVVIDPGDPLSCGALEAPRTVAEGLGCGLGMEVGRGVRVGEALGTGVGVGITRTFALGVAAIEMATGVGLGLAGPSVGGPNVGPGLAVATGVG